MTSAALLLLAVVAAQATSALSSPAPVSNVFEIDISPEEAQRYLANPPYTEPQLSVRTAQLPLVRWNDPRFRSAEAGPTLGHYWRNGHEIENTDDYVEEVYDASQYHGQDGLGAFAYGYSGPDSAKVESRQRSGDVAGSYTYRDGNNDVVKVRYWADSEGFHQEDDRPPQSVPQPPQETADVREARLAHERAWQEAAAAASRQPDPQGEYSAAEYDTFENRNEYSGAASAPRAVTAEREGRQQVAHSVTAQQEGRQQVAPSVTSEREGRQQVAPSVTAEREGRQQHRQQYQPEPTGPPRGFFYSFTYPVSSLVPVAGARSADGADTVAVSARAH